MIAARRTYADAMVNLFWPDAFPYHFTDVQGHFDTLIIGGVRFAATAYDGVDAIKRPAGDNEFFAGEWGNRVIGATLSKTFARGVRSILGADSLALAQRVSTTRYDIHLDVPERLLRVANRITDLRTGGSVTLYHPVWTHEIGYELSSEEASYYANGPAGFGDLIPFDSLAQRSRTASVYGDALWRPASSLIVEGGVRVDALDGARGSIVGPRLSLKYFVTPDIAFIAATGRMHSGCTRSARGGANTAVSVLGVERVGAVGVARRSRRVERWVSPRRVFHVEAFNKRYEHLLVPNSAHAFDVPGDEFIPVGGTSYGADVLLRQLDGGPFSGWLAYTYAVSTRVNAEGVHSVPTQDRRHNLNLVGSWRAGAYALGARVHVASGAPYTPIIGEFVRAVYDAATKRWVADNAQPPRQDIPGDFHSARVPFYQSHRRQRAAQRAHSRRVVRAVPEHRESSEREESRGLHLFIQH